MLTWPVATVGWVTSIVQQAEASQKRINEFLKLEPEIKNTVATKTEIVGDIAFKNVSFTYDDTNINALKNIERIKSSEKEALLSEAEILCRAARDIGCPVIQLVPFCGHDD